MKVATSIIAVLILNGCAQSGYSKFYSANIDTRTFPDLELLQAGKAPQILSTDDFARDIRLLRTKGYVIVGSSSFNGVHENARNAEAQAKKVGASIVLTNSEYTNTQTSSSVRYVPNTQTTHSSGTVYAGGSSGSYRGKTTTHGTTAVPYSVSHSLYDQHAVYLVKYTKKLKFGVSIIDLSPTQRVEIERNTGVFVDIVVEDTPAFYANLLAGDIVIEIDGIMVRNARHARELMRAVDDSAASSSLTVIRGGSQKEIALQF